MVAAELLVELQLATPGVLLAGALAAAQINADLVDEETRTALQRYRVVSAAAPYGRVPDDLPVSDRASLGHGIRTGTRLFRLTSLAGCLDNDPSAELGHSPDSHVVAALDERGALLGVESFDTTLRGYRRAWRWLRSFGELEVAGVEGTGSYGAGLTQFLHDRGVVVVEWISSTPATPSSGPSSRRRHLGLSH